MGAIEHLTFAVPADLADSIRSHVMSGEYASENDIVVEALRLWSYDEGLEDDPDVEAWLRREVLPALEEYDRDPSRALTGEQVLANLAAARMRRTEQG